MDVSKRISELREKRGMTVNKLANEAGISQSFLREVERGIKRPTVDTLSLICDALRISLRDFFDKEAFSSTDELDQIIFRLTPDQRQKLAEFLKSIR